MNKLMAILFGLLFLNNLNAQTFVSKKDTTVFKLEYQSQWIINQDNFNKENINKIVSFLKADKINHKVKVEFFYDDKSKNSIRNRANCFYKQLNKAGYYGKAVNNRQLLFDFYGVDNYKEYEFLFLGLIYLIEE